LARGEFKPEVAEDQINDVPGWELGEAVNQQQPVVATKLCIARRSGRLLSERFNDATTRKMPKVADRVDRVIEQQKNGSGSFAAFRQKGGARKLRQVDERRRRLTRMRLDRIVAIDDPGRRPFGDQSADLAHQFKHPGRKNARRA
jgi:hypothetical protein